MRIRQVRPEFFTDPVMASFTPLVRLTYIGLWCVADDAGWLPWDVPQIGAQLFPFEASKRRERDLGLTLAVLSGAGRVVLHPCNCLHIPHLVDHQKIGGNKSLVHLERHRVHTGLDQSARNVRVGEGRVSNGSAGASATKGDPALLDAYRRQGLPVDVAG